MVNFGPLTAEIGWRVWGTPANFNMFRVLASLMHRRVAQRRSTKLSTMFGRLLGWYTMHTFLGLLLLREFCQVQHSLCVQVLRSPILAALLHGIYSTTFNGRRHLYSEGGHHVGHRLTF